MGPGKEGRGGPLDEIPVRVRFVQGDFVGREGDGAQTNRNRTGISLNADRLRILPVLRGVARGFDCDFPVAARFTKADFVGEGETEAERIETRQGNHTEI